jgi:hypothetical protein
MVRPHLQLAMLLLAGLSMLAVGHADSSDSSSAGELCPGAAVLVC